MRYFMILIIMFGVLPAGLFADGIESKKYENGNILIEDVYPGNNWEKVSSPETIGYSKAALAEAVSYIKTTEVDALVVVVGGRILLEYGNTDSNSVALFSARKSIVSMLFGKHVASGKIKLDETISSLQIDDIGGLLPIEKTATLEHLLTFRSGVYHKSAADQRLPKRGVHKPGTTFVYNEWNANAACLIFEQKTGMSIYKALEKDLVLPLQMQDYVRFWQIPYNNMFFKKTNHLQHEMVFSARDMARLGYLMLKKGRWKNQQLIPESWVEKTTTLVTSPKDAGQKDGMYGYGYLWWIYDKGEAGKRSYYENSYSAWGAYGQLIAVFPKLNMVIVHKSDLGVPGYPYRLLPSFLARKIFSTTPHQSDMIIEKIVAAKK